MLNKEEVDAFIKAAFLELGPSCDDEWAQECAKKLREVAVDVDTKRIRPPEFYRPTLRAVDPPPALVGGGNSENSAGN